MQFIDLNTVVLNVIDLVSVQFKKYNIEIKLLLEENLGKVYGDKIALEQLIINLLVNAKDAINEKKYVENLDFEGRIQIHSLNQDDAVNLVIEDNGIGITDDTIKKIWSPFYTTKRRSNSTGIGLSISKKIISEHNARVLLESRPSLGTRFTISFPANREKQIISIS